MLRSIQLAKSNKDNVMATYFLELSSSLFSQTIVDFGIRDFLADIRPPFSGCSLIKLMVKFHHCSLVGGISSFSHTKFASTLEIFFLISCTSILLVIIKEFELLIFF